MKKLIPLLLLSPLLSFAAETTTMQSKASIVNTCEFSANNVVYGAVILRPGEHSTQSTMAVKCSKALAYTIKFSTGNSGIYTSRYMRNTTTPNDDKLLYQLRVGNPDGRLWGDGTGTTDFYRGMGNGANQSVTIYSSIGTSQYVSPGAYVDDIVALLEY